MKKKGVLSLSIFVILMSILVISKRPINNLIEYDENTTLALFNEDGSKIDQVPSRDSGYILDTKKSSCANGSISWDTDSWSPVVTVNNEVNGRVSCTLYFKEATAYDQCIVQYGEEIFLCNVIADLNEEKCPTVNKDGTINVTAENQDGYVCSAPDDYGTSYYYRGNVTNNYVKFGTNESGQDMYWRIIRINGDGSIRMIYDGTRAHVNGEDSDDRNIGTSSFNEWINAGVGDFPWTDSVSYTYNNHQNDSVIKSYVDAWYEKVFLGSKYEVYLSDEIFCTSRVIGESSCSYELLDSLICTNEEDRYTVDEAKGNGGLKYPIGLVTAIEGRLAGGVGTVGVIGQYLDAGIYWTMSPFYYDHGCGLTVYTINDGMVSQGLSLDVTSTSGVKPVINLKSNSLKSGAGTMDNPYTVG